MAQTNENVHEQLRLLFVSGAGYVMTVIKIGHTFSQYKTTCTNSTSRDSLCDTGVCPADICNKCLAFLSFYVWKDKRMLVIQVYI